jgi:hypothetical protein
MGQLDYQHSADEYDLGQQFMDAAQQTVNNYSEQLPGLSAEQIQAVRQAAMDAYNMGLRGGGASLAGGAGSGDLADFMYGNTIPGYSDEELWNAAQSANPNGTPMHIMQNGQILDPDGSPWNGSGPKGIFVKYQQADGTNTIWIPLPAPQTGPTPPAQAPPPTQAPPSTAPTVRPSPAPIPTQGGTYYVGGGLRLE